MVPALNTLTMPASAHSASVAYTQITHTLTYIAGTGGTVTAPATSPTTHNYGAVVTITASPNTGYHFVNWSGDVSTVADVNAASTTITMNGNYTVTANFAIDTHTLTIAKAGTGSGTVVPAVGVHPYGYGTVVTLEATAASGSTFDGWSGDPDCEDGSVTMNADKACTATFTLNTYDLTIAKAGTGSGTVTPTVGVHPYDYGTVVTLSATALLVPPSMAGVAILIVKTALSP